MIKIELVDVDSYNEMLERNYDYLIATDIDLNNPVLKKCIGIIKNGLNKTGDDPVDILFKTGDTIVILFL